MTERIVPEDHAKVQIFYDGECGELAVTVPFESSDTEILRVSGDALRKGDVPGMHVHDQPDFEGFVVERYLPEEVDVHAVISIRPQTSFD
jgi:hypothetical protein